MPTRPRLLSLPSEVLDELDVRLRDSGFADYLAHATWLGERGHTIGKSAVYDYSKRHRARIEAGRGRAAPLPGPSEAVKRADQRIECLKVVAAMPLCDLNATSDDLKAAAADLHRWAYEAPAP